MASPTNEEDEAIEVTNANLNFHASEHGTHGIHDRSSVTSISSSPSSPLGVRRSSMPSRMCGSGFGRVEGVGNAGGMGVGGMGATSDEGVGVFGVVSGFGGYGEADRSHVTQIRMENAVGDLGVIETGLPPARRDTKRAKGEGTHKDGNHGKEGKDVDSSDRTGGDSHNSHGAHFCTDLYPPENEDDPLENGSIASKSIASTITGTAASVMGGNKVHGTVKRIKNLVRRNSNSSVHTHETGSHYAKNNNIRHSRSSRGAAYSRGNRGSRGNRSVLSGHSNSKHSNDANRPGRAILTKCVVTDYDNSNSASWKEELGAWLCHKNRNGSGDRVGPNGGRILDKTDDEHGEHGGATGSGSGNNHPRGMGVSTPMSPSTITGTIGGSNTTSSSSGNPLTSDPHDVLQGFSQDDGDDGDNIDNNQGLPPGEYLVDLEDPRISTRTEDTVPSDNFRRKSSTGSNRSHRETMKEARNKILSAQSPDGASTASTNKNSRTVASGGASVGGASVGASVGASRASKVSRASAGASKASAGASRVSATSADKSNKSTNSHKSNKSNKSNMAPNLRRRKPKKALLHPMRVDIPSGSITAILGTADSGKSTLLKFLAGCMDGNIEYEGSVNLPGTTAYLPQQCHLHRFYTPRTYLRHYHRLISARGGIRKANWGGHRRSSTGSGTTRGSRHTGGGSNGLGRMSEMQSKDVEKLLDSLRIDRDRRDVIVGDMFRRGLSAGERRRLELGLLVLASPDTLFCEDPVEGFDSETSLHIMEFLKGFSSNSARRVIVTLTKPSLFVWNLIDNVILLSQGRIVYEGPRFDMEAFFAYNKMPTPGRFSPLEHYLAVVNNFRRPGAAVNWEAAFKMWQEEADKDDGDYLADELEICFPTAIPDVIIPRINTYGLSGNDEIDCNVLCICNGWSGTFLELTKRYLFQMVLNPGILQLRFVMYACFCLFEGMLFYNLDHDFSYQSVNSWAALIFYNNSFVIFMVVAVLPFHALDRSIRDKEVLNGFYNPVTHHLALSVATIPSAFILSAVITLILVGLVKFKNGVYFFLITSLGLWCSESLAILISLCVENYIIGIIVMCGICGILMPLQGFMLVPSKFPDWLGWAYHVPFHTYAFRSLMYNEFSNRPLSANGMAVLESYEIEDTNIYHDMLVLFCYGLIIHAISILGLHLGNDFRIRQCF